MQADDRANSLIKNNFISFIFIFDGNSPAIGNYITTRINGNV